jgi:molybdopterin synthase sulfur carrier subunit
MSIVVELPNVLREYAGNRGTVELEHDCSTLADVLSALGAEWPGVVDRVLDEQGEIREHVNLFVGEESAKFNGGLEAPVSDGDTIVIVPAVSGG